MFVTSPCADTSINVGANNNLCVQIDIHQDRVEHIAKSSMLSVVAGEEYRHQCNQDVFAFDAFATVVKGGKFEFEADYSARKFLNPSHLVSCKKIHPCCQIKNDDLNLQVMLLTGDDR